MRIALIYDAIYPDVVGGGEKRYWEIARRLVRRGHEVWLLGMQFWPGEAIIRRDGVVCVGVCPAIPLFTSSGRRSLWEPLYFAWHLYQFLRHHSFDVIDCGAFPYLPCFVSKFHAISKRMPLVITWFELRGWSGWWAYCGGAGILAYMFEIYVARLTRWNIAISGLTLERAGQLFPRLAKNMQVIGCGVDAPRNSLFRVRAKNPCRLLCIGRIVEHKRMHWLIDVLRELISEFPGLSLLIVGEGPEKNRVTKYAEECGCRSNVVFRGFLSIDELQEEMTNSDIFLFPSEQEGFGMVIIEAMAAGLPVVAADAPMSAARTLVSHGNNGLLCTSSNSMVGAVRNLIRDELLYEKVSRGAQRTAVQHDWESEIITELERYYCKCQTQ